MWYFSLGAIFAFFGAIAAYLIADNPRDRSEGYVLALLVGASLFFLWPLGAPIGLAILTGRWYANRTRVK